MKSLSSCIHYFREKRYALMIQGLLDTKNNEKMISKLTVLQNEISVAYDTKVLAITSIKDDELSAAFAYALAEAYHINGSSSLIIDANLFDPRLSNLLKKEKEGEDLSIQNIADGIDGVFMNQEIYPSITYKSKAIQKLIEDNKDKYDHFIVLVPSVYEHKEIALLGDAIDSTLLVTRQDVTKKKDIYEALCFLATEKIKVSKTVVLH